MSRIERIEWFVTGYKPEGHVHSTQEKKVLIRLNENGEIISGTRVIVGFNEIVGVMFFDHHRDPVHIPRIREWAYMPHDGQPSVG